MRTIIRYIITATMIIGVLFLGLNLIKSINAEIQFHQNHILSFEGTSYKLELDKEDVDDDGNMKLKGTMYFDVELNQDQFNNFWAEQKPIDIINQKVIVELNSDLNLFNGNIKIDDEKDYYSGSSYFIWEKVFHSKIEFDFADIYVKLPEEAYLENGDIDSEFEYNMFISFKSVVYNSETTGKDPIYTNNHRRWTFNIIENEHGRLMFRQKGEGETIHDEIAIQDNFIDKIKNKFKKFWGD